MEWWHVYLFTRLDVVGKLLVLASVFGLMGCCVNVVLSFWWEGSETADEDISVRAKLREFTPRLFVAWIVLVVAAAAIPTQKEAAAIYLLPKLANSDFAKEVGQIPTDAAKLMRLKLEAWIAEMEPKIEKK